jgi:hypothetical protein
MVIHRPSNGHRKIWCSTAVLQDRGGVEPRPASSSTSHATSRWCASGVASGDRVLLFHLANACLSGEEAQAALHMLVATDMYRYALHTFNAACQLVSLRGDEEQARHCLQVTMPLDLRGDWPWPPRTPPDSSPGFTCKGKCHLRSPSACRDTAMACGENLQEGHIHPPPGLPSFAGRIPEDSG